MASEHLEFSLNLHHQLAPPVDRSFCWSPYSVVSALGLAAGAAGGQTRAELDTMLKSSVRLAELREWLSSAAELNQKASNPPQLAVANTLWAHEDIPIHDSFLRDLEQWPGSAVRNAPFRADPDTARRLINDDVSETTRGLIPELLAPGAVEPNTVAALVNALYLKVSWQEAFDEHATEQRPFHAPGGEHDVPTMRVTRNFGYAARDGWQVVSLPAIGGVEAVVLMPDDGLAAAEPQLTPDLLERLVSSPEKRRLELSLPKFDVSASAELNAALATLGVRTLFTRQADFSVLTDFPLQVSTVQHESVLRIDENGLEGAAATAVMMRLTSIVKEDDPLRVHIDRPFVFLVRHRETGALYFVARVTDPG